MFNMSPIYSERNSSNHKSSKTHKISPDINSRKTKTHKIFEELVPSVLAQLIFFLKHTRLGHAGIVEHSVDLSIPIKKKKSVRKL